MNISADEVLAYILVAVGGFLVKAFLDWIKSVGEEKNEKAKKFEEKNLREEIEKIVTESNKQLKKELIEDLSSFQTETKATYDYWQKMYWDAIGRLNDTQKEFEVLKEQDVLFHKYLLIDTCKEYLAVGEMTQYQFDILTEWYKMYKALGGNSQGDLYYKRAVTLPIVPNEHDEIDKEMHSIFDYQDQVKKDSKKSKGSN